MIWALHFDTFTASSSATSSPHISVSQSHCYSGSSSPGAIWKPPKYCWFHHLYVLSYLTPCLVLVVYLSASDPSSNLLTLPTLSHIHMCLMVIATPDSAWNFPCTQQGKCISFLIFIILFRLLFDFAHIIILCPQMMHLLLIIPSCLLTAHYYLQVHHC